MQVPGLRSYVPPGLPSNETLGPVVLDLPQPPSVNKTRKLNKAALRRVAAWHVAADRTVTYQWAQAKLKKSSRPRHLLDQPVEIIVRLSEKLRLDLDNSLKVLIDYLVRIEVITDDRKKYLKRIIVEWCPPSESPEGVRVFVRSWAGALPIAVEPMDSPRDTGPAKLS